MTALDDLVTAIDQYVMSDTTTIDARTQRYYLIGWIASLYDESVTRATERFDAMCAVQRAAPRKSFGIMPSKLANRETGWGDDGDRDSTQAARLASLVRDMDARVESWLSGELEHDAVGEYIEAARIMRMWQEIRRITRSEGGQ